jgi:hypothetical protein
VVVVIFLAHKLAQLEQSAADALVAHVVLAVDLVETGLHIVRTEDKHLYGLLPEVDYLGKRRALVFLVGLVESLQNSGCSSQDHNCFPFESVDIRILFLISKANLHYFLHSFVAFVLQVERYEFCFDVGWPKVGIFLEDQMMA